jgi:hypothetical protein
VFAAASEADDRDLAFVARSFFVAPKEVTVGEQELLKERCDDLDRPVNFSE